jgi:hypothetical protein
MNVSPFPFVHQYSKAAGEKQGVTDLQKQLTAGDVRAMLTKI